MNWPNVGKIVSSVAHTVNNDVIQPVQRDVQRPIMSFLHNPTPPSNFTPAPMQKLNLTEGGNIQQLAPQVQTQPANDTRLKAQKDFQLTPNFTQNLVNAAPFDIKQASIPNPALPQGGAGAEYLGHQVPNQIVSTPSSDDSGTLLHEGLHRVYDTNPQVQKQFAQAYNKSVTPGIKAYLAARLYPYAGFAKGLDEGGVPIPNYDLSKIENLPPNLRNEAHSFLAELPNNGGELPGALNKYYSNYFNPGTTQRNAIKRIESSPPPPRRH